MAYKKGGKTNSVTGSSGITNVGNDVDADLAPTYGSSANTVCQGNDSRLSDARTPTAHNTSHQSGGSDAIKLDDLASPDDNTDLNVSTSAHGLMNKLSNDDDEFLSGQGNWKKVFPEFQFFADQMENPVNSDWAVNDLAVAAADSNNNGLTIRLFDDTDEEGVGFSLQIPEGSTNIVFDIVSRRESSGSAQAVVPKLYVRELPDNAAVESWSAGTDMTAISLPADEDWQYDNQSIALSTLSLVADRVAQFELTRNTGAGGDTLSGDWTVLLVKVSFT